MTAGWLLDTSALAVAQHPQVLGRLAPLLDAGLMYTCPVLDLEALAVARSPENHRRLAEERRDAYRAVPLAVSTGQRALALQARLVRRAHHPALDPNDLLVAATAIENSLTLLHYQRGFELLGELGELDQRPVAPLGTLS
jgi:predicted nucleic acid-binding protein